MKKPDPQFKLRLPPELKERLEKSAQASARSLTAEIIVRLESSYRHGVTPERGTGDPTSVYLRPFQQMLFEQVRKIVRLEALLGAPKLTSEQKAELAKLKKSLEDKD
jgi:hypothetical protein